MPARPRAYVLDTWAALAYFEDRPAAERVEAIIADSHERGIPLMMTTVNAAEIWYTFARKSSEQRAEESLQDIRQLGVAFYDADLRLAIVAAKFKARNKMSLADCFAAALAKEHRADLVTGDPEFKQVEGEVRIAWLA